MITLGILTISDRCSRGERQDLSGPALREYCATRNWDVKFYEIVPDDELLISEKILDWCKNKKINLILTTGGTGFSPRDVTPEATMKVIERSAPGIMEYLRIKSVENNKHAILSRGIAGSTGETLIINLPGSNTAVLECIGFISDVIPHACELLKNDENSEKHHKS